MTKAQLNATPLKAPWNRGGTYLSAFEVPSQGTISQSPQTDELVYVGEIATIFQGKSGYLLTLTVRHADGSDLRIWLQNVVATAPSGGPALWAKLQSGSITTGMLVFALGTFIRQTTSGSAVFYSMPVVDARRVWIVDTAQAGTLLGVET